MIPNLDWLSKQITFLSWLWQENVGGRQFVGLGRVIFSFLMLSLKSMWGYPGEGYKISLKCSLGELKRGSSQRWVLDEVSPREYRRKKGS